MAAHSIPDASALDNPFWSALRSRHAHLAIGTDAVARYPADHAPFLGVAHADVEADAALAALLAPGESVYLIGVAPRVPTGTKLALDFHGDLVQMIRTEPMLVPDGPAIVPLGDAQREDVLALTALVYPHYFRARTLALGRYFGICVDGRLAAMAGERLATDRYQELSAICTHPDFLGRGYARRLTAWLANDVLAAGRTPYLHVSPANARAKSLYEAMGFRLRSRVPFWSLRREG
ncbi:MAG: GNAT family N-acetyltransferase [Lysobacteraceae bacterium]